MDVNSISMFKRISRASLFGWFEIRSPYQLFSLLRDFFRFCIRTPREFVLWGQTGLGDLIMSASLIEFWSSKSELLHIPVKKKYLVLAEQLFGYLDNLKFHEVPDNHWEEANYVRTLSTRLGLKKLRIGGPRYYWLKSRLNNYGLNQILSMGGFCLFHNFQSKKFANYYRLNNTQPGETIADKYIFVDTHEGTHREVPPGILENKLKGGTLIIKNSLDYSFLKLGKLMDDAEELHLVSSSPLCLALVLGIQSRRQVHYVIDPTHRMYADSSGLPWVTFDLSSMREIDTHPNLELQKTSGTELLLRLLCKFNKMGATVSQI